MKTFVFLKRKEITALSCENIQFPLTVFLVIFLSKSLKSDGKWKLRKISLRLTYIYSSTLADSNSIAAPNDLCFRDPWDHTNDQKAKNEEVHRKLQLHTKRKHIQTE